MSIDPDTCRTLDQALGDLYDKLDRTPVESADGRLNLDRMIEGLEAEIAVRGERVLARYA
jgi:hypothetical protein